MSTSVAWMLRSLSAGFGLSIQAEATVSANTCCSWITAIPIARCATTARLDVLNPLRPEEGLFARAEPWEEHDAMSGSSSACPYSFSPSIIQTLKLAMSGAAGYPVQHQCQSVLRLCSDMSPHLEHLGLL